MNSESRSAGNDSRLNRSGKRQEIFGVIPVGFETRCVDVNLSLLDECANGNRIFH